MTNREWLETLSDEMLAEIVQIVCAICPAYMGHGSCYRGGDHCARNTKEWLTEQHEAPKRDFTLYELMKKFRDKFQDRRALSFYEVENMIKELFK